MITCRLKSCLASEPLLSTTLKSNSDRIPSSDIPGLPVRNPEPLASGKYSSQEGKTVSSCKLGPP